MEPEESLCRIKLRQLKNMQMQMEKIKIAYLPVNSSLSSTGHKLQGKTLDHLVVKSWEYNTPHWVYVIVSRVKTLIGLILN